jgi:5-methylthioadenosine/S-adenosylhomocysteine deaminase
MASNNRMDLLEEARIALLAQRARLQSNETPSAANMLELATIEGAKALGIDGHVGTLEEGKQADLAAFSLDGVMPSQDPIAAAIYSVNGARARFTMVAGRVLVRDGALTHPRPGLPERMRQLGESLAEWLASGGEMQGVV